MENITYVGISQQMALQQQIEVTANNIANMSTPGFKSNNVLFTDYITKPKGGEALHQSQDYATYRDLSFGNLIQTHNQLDMAIHGEGYFTVSTKEGAKFTRDGGFSLNLNRELVTKSGHLVLNENDNAIVFPSDATQIRVSDDGNISSEQGNIGRLKIVQFEDEQKMKKVGDNMYDANGQTPQIMPNRKIVQGELEGSNVNPVSEMNRMIELMRLFQAAQRMLQTDHDRQLSAIQKLTRPA
ncbi:MAG TPA: flagellar basal-body rod protein FlgF [Patescibacteria group bacterium]|nr:flagellar basal-body rod protein FlgF [Patescibacteria group bacterium]